MRLALLALALAVSGCVATVHERPPPRVGPVLLLTEQQAVDLAAHHARARGLDVTRTTRTFLDARSRWHVELAGPGSHASFVIDAAGGRVLNARYRLGPPAAPRPEQKPDKPRDDDWDE